MRKPWESGRLCVSEKGRYLQNGKKPFFWLGDTAWLLIEKLTEQEMQAYLRNRAEKNFNVVQAVLVHHSGMQDAAGNAALCGDDFQLPDTEHGFWDSVDTLVKLAEQEGLYVALLPVWGSMVKGGFLNMSNAEAYGAFLATRYKSRPNIIWLIGGDVRGNEGYEVWNLLATTIKSIASKQLMGFHPFGRTRSALWFHEQLWLDFNMFQSGHRRYDQASLGAWDDNNQMEGFVGEDSWKYVLRDYEMNPAKPTLDGEPSYELIPQGLHDSTQPYWQACDARRYAYWSVFAGACGHTYGNNAVMQFYRREDKEASYGALNYWHEAVHDTGSGQMGHLYNLMCSVDFSTGHMAEEWLGQPQGEKYERISVFSGEGFAFFYTYTGQPFKVSLQPADGAAVHASWFDPVTGTYSYIGQIQGGGVKEFIPPNRRMGQNDWVLVLKAE